jgi:hypothetical protein
LIEIKSIQINIPKKMLRKIGYSNGFVHGNKVNCFYNTIVN